MANRFASQASALNAEVLDTQCGYVRTHQTTRVNAWRGTALLLDALVVYITRTGTYGYCSLTHSNRPAKKRKCMNARCGCATLPVNI